MSLSPQPYRGLVTEAARRGALYAPVGLLVLEREAEGGQKSERGIVVAGIGHEGDVHAAGAVDLVVLDLREDELLGDAQGVVCLLYTSRCV